MKNNIANQLVQMLKDAGIKRIYAVAGDSLNYINDAINTEGSIRWIHVRHEESGAYAASAEAQLTGLACCAGSSGPGHVHLINGLYDAHRSSASVLALASTCHSSEYGTSYFQETNTIKLFDDCSCYNQLASTVQQFPRMIQTALQHAIHKKGVAVIGFPGNLTAMEAVSLPTSMQVFRTSQVVIPSTTELQSLAAILNESTKITIFCGKGANDSLEEIIKLSQLLNAPVGYSLHGKMALQHNNPNEVGMTGLLGLPSAYKSMHEAEVLLLLGTDFPYTEFMPTDLKIIQIDIAPEHLGRRAKLEMGLCGNIKETVVSLIPLINQKNENEFLLEQLKYYKKVKANLKVLMDDKGTLNAIHPEYVTSIISELSTNDAIFTVDTGMTCVWAASYLQATGKRTLLGSFNHGSMANAIPQAVGAALACPERQIVALCGDGGLSMNPGDLMTIVQYKLPVKIIVFNNSSLAMVKIEMEVAGLQNWQTDMVNPDFAKLGEAMGIQSYTINDPNEVLATLEKAFAYNGAVLVNIITDPHALAMPAHITFDQIKGITKTMGKYLLNGRISEIWKTLVANKNHVVELF